MKSSSRLLLAVTKYCGDKKEECSQKEKKRATAGTCGDRFNGTGITDRSFFFLAHFVLTKLICIAETLRLFIYIKDYMHYILLAIFISLIAEFFLPSIAMLNSKNESERKLVNQYFPINNEINENIFGQ